MISGNSKKFTFTSYINTKESNASDESTHFELLSGEIISVFADVQLVSLTLTGKAKSIPGKLYVSNFKLSFVPLKKKCYKQDRLLRGYDVTLSNIDEIYEIIDKKKKRILPQQKINSKIDGLFVICKNFRYFEFWFEGVSKEHGTLVASALARFAFPSKYDLSFAFYYKEVQRSKSHSNVRMFNSKKDWILELKRCNASQWKVVTMENMQTEGFSNNSQMDFETSRHMVLPKFFVIPKCFKEKDFFSSVSAFREFRSACWVYSYAPTAASLVRMGELKSYEKGRLIENITLEKVRNCDPEKKSIEFKNLSEQILPDSHDVRNSYLKLRDLCTPQNTEDFLNQDSKYNSLLEKSGWFKCISSSLQFSFQISELLRNGTTVVLQEHNGREMCCVISSITQILLDPYYRTFEGFQSLIQKEWIALEHPFSDKLGHTLKKENFTNAGNNIKKYAKYNNFYRDSNSTVESPLLLMFLDCTWQLLQQFPEEFEYSETYLSAIWDSAFMPIFDTFQFNNEFDRYVAVAEKNLVLRPVWDWNLQYEDKDQICFFNPYFSKQHLTRSFSHVENFTSEENWRMYSKCLSQKRYRSTIPSNRHLIPFFGVSDLYIWKQCYFRWIPVLEIENGGISKVEMLHRLLLINISKLQFLLYKGE